MVTEVRLPVPQGTVYPLYFLVKTSYSNSMKNETTSNQARAIACVNAIKAYREGFAEVAETYAPGFAQFFFSLDSAGRSEMMDNLLSALAV